MRLLRRNFSSLYDCFIVFELPTPPVLTPPSSVPALASVPSDTSLMSALSKKVSKIVKMKKICRTHMPVVWKRNGMLSMF